MWMPCAFSVWTFQILKILEGRPRTDIRVDFYICQGWQPWYERERERDFFFLIHIPPGSCISFSPLLSLAFYLESRLKIYKAINNGFPAGGEGLWWRFCDCLNRLHSCSVVTPFGCLPCFVESLMVRFTLYPLITLCSIKEITYFVLICQLFPHILHQMIIYYYCCYYALFFVWATLKVQEMRQNISNKLQIKLLIPNQMSGKYFYFNHQNKQRLLVSYFMLCSTFEILNLHWIFSSASPWRAAFYCIISLRTVSSVSVPPSMHLFLWWWRQNNSLMFSF